MSIHKEFRKGQKIRIILKDKRLPHLLGRFKESGSTWIEIDTQMKVDFKAIRAVTIDKPINREG